MAIFYKQDLQTGELIPFKLTDNGDGTFSEATVSSLSDDVSTTLYAGTVALTSGSAVAIAASQAVSEVIVQNDPDNTVDILIGNASSQPIQLKPGQSMTIPISNLSSVYAKSVSGTPTLSYLGRD